MVALGAESAQKHLIATRFSLGTCQKLAGWRGGGWKQGEGHNFLRLRKGRGHEKWAVKRGRVMQIYALDHVEVHPRKKKEVLYFVKKKKKKKEQWNIMDTNYEVLYCKNLTNIYFSFITML